MNKELAYRSEFFFEMEARDEQQMIKEYEGRVLKEITYQVQGQTAISYDGIKFIVGKLGHIKVLHESIRIEFIEKPVEMWVATVVALNEKYGIQLPGAGEQPYMMEVRGVLKPDPFARRKALSKATRNALRAVIPEPMIIKFLEDVKKGSDFNPPATRKEVVAEVVEEHQFTAWDGDLSIANIQAYLTANGLPGEKFKIRHDEPSRMYVVDKAPFIDEFDKLKAVVFEMGGEYDRDHKKTVFKY